MMSESMAIAHQSVAEFGHCIGFEVGWLDTSVQIPQSEHVMAAKSLFWAQIAKAPTGCLTTGASGPVVRATPSRRTARAAA
jgi:hypothetical protein